MKTSFPMLSAALRVTVCAAALIFGHSIASNDDSLVRSAISADPAISKTAIASLRAEGPAGLDALFAAHQTEIDAILSSPTAAKANAPEWKRLCHALDEVAQQHDDFTSHLYWYTDLDAAKTAAKASGKPILSLRLLGKLDEDFSCANSRLFRTVLYTDAEVSARLRSDYILHWETVRPAPKMTIDFGDGRKLERTITGNSIHYILDPNGNVIDALPGLYGPKAFLAALAIPPLVMQQHPEKFTPAQWLTSLHDYQRGQLENDLRTWKAKSTALNPALFQNTRARKSAAPFPAAAADIRTMGKSAIERPILRALGPVRDELVKTTDQATWEKLAEERAAQMTLDQHSIALMRIKRLACSGDGAVATDLSPVVQNLQKSLAADTVRNEYLFRTAILQWLVDGTAPNDLNQLNDKIYAELFLTPNSDPWLGLKPESVYSALDGEGIVAN